MSEYISLKYYFDKELALRLSDLIQPQYPAFSKTAFVDTVTAEVENKELKARVEVIADALKQYLPMDYEKALAVLLNILGPENETEEGMFTKGYFLMPVAFFVEKYGLDHFDLSFHAMYEITKRHTSEYAIRPYLMADMDRCMDYFQYWIKDPNPHIRRLVSEGTRPRLPWAKKMPPLKNDVQNNLFLLEQFMCDKSRYVQKSVANHINDLTKENPEAVLEWMQQYISDNKDVNRQMIKNGLRTLIKLKDKHALALLRQVE
ncbi:DNA alkylation repair protein [Oceanobacillus sp. CFH 90083]|uniref:DNA alkylation repair protein n=1 Tax=Oceanobacillus sp. CFH 90083 TaxID=2592336 RepID=UPI00128D708D|nr:DNA alkylation repair protein [Oceanobacillus sp. CFH 90083]